MSESNQSPFHIQSRILSHLQSSQYRPKNSRSLARELNLHEDQEYGGFREALRELMRAGRVILGGGGDVLLPTQQTASNEFVGSYRHNRRGFGFVVPTDPGSHEDLYIPEGQNAGAITGDIVAAKIIDRGQRDGKAIYSGRIMRIIQRTQRHFAGTLVREGGEWLVLPDGNTLTEAIAAPDAASRHVRPGTKVVIEITSFPQRPNYGTAPVHGQAGAKIERPQGVITQILGKLGEKDVDLKSVIVQFNLPGDFPEAVTSQARQAVNDFDPAQEAQTRLDLSEDIICTIDPDDAKDYDDAISLRQLDNGHWELGVHIADVSCFVPDGTPLDEEARTRGNSCYFPGHVIPMLPEILSNGVCSLQEAVPRLCKSAFIVYDDDARPISTRFANTIIRSRKRLRYTEAQAIIDSAQEIPHPEGARRPSDYDEAVIDLLRNMNLLARRLQERRRRQGQIVLELPEVELVLDEDGRVVDAVPEDTSFTHTIIEMFMVEANEAVARLLDSLDVPFLRRVHPEPEVHDSERLRHFAQVTGYKLDKEMNRRALQKLLASVKGKPEAFAINLAVLKSLTRAEYSPEPIGHYALASEHYCHFTSPIRRYADLTIHRLLDAYFAAKQEIRPAHSNPRQSSGESSSRLPEAPEMRHRSRPKLDRDLIVPHDELVEMGRHISFTERRAEDAERELRQVKVLELMQQHLGDIFNGIVTGITKFGIFVQLQSWLVDGLIRYENLLDDWWDVDERSGQIRGERTGKRIAIGDLLKVAVARVDVARRELDLSVVELLGRPGGADTAGLHSQKKATQKQKLREKKLVTRERGKKSHPRGGQTRRNR